MVLLPDIYCPEQIVIPENFNTVLKVYAKGTVKKFFSPPRRKLMLFSYSFFFVSSRDAADCYHRHLDPAVAPEAVIRTQPYDLLRWSAAYFRCLSLDRLPPVKLRYEPEARRGRLSTGALRVLIDQVIIASPMYMYSLL